jgi:Transcriptional regulator
MNNTDNVRAVDRSLDILEALANQQRGVGLTELAISIGIPKTTTLRILKTLAQRGYVKQDHDTQDYHLGPQTLIVGKGFLDQLNYRALAVSYMKKLRDIIDESVSLYIITGNNRLCIERVDSNQPLRSNVSVGDLLPLDKGAAGRLLLAYSGRRDGPSDHEQILRAGYAISHGEREPGSLAGIAMPIRDYRGEVCAALSISGPAHRYEGERKKQYIQLMFEAVRSISKEMGYKGK